MLAPIPPAEVSGVYPSHSISIEEDTAKWKGRRIRPSPSRTHRLQFLRKTVKVVKRTAKKVAPYSAELTAAAKAVRLSAT